MFMNGNSCQFYIKLYQDKHLINCMSSKDKNSQFLLTLQASHVFAP